jgi:sugar fermentation stimulation protein A
MKFSSKLIPGLFIKRYKRFFVDIRIDSKIVTAHCPNTGSMLGLLKKNNKVWVSKSNNPNRKLKFTLEIIEDKNKKIGVNTHSTNKIVSQALKDRLFKEFGNILEIKTETIFNKNTRFDFFIKNKKNNIFVEVKNVTLSRKFNIAEFPDSITERGSKHINELIDATKKGYKSYILFVVQRNDCKYFKIASDIDIKYSNLIKEAVKKKINILCYDCKFSSKGIKLNKPLKILI